MRPANGGHQTREIRTIVLSANAMICMSFKKQMMKSISDGFPGGCLKAFSGSGSSQYSSSHAMGRSKSKLVRVPRGEVNRTFKC